MGNQQQVVVFAYQGVAVRNGHLAVPPYPGDDELQMTQHCDVVHALVENGRVADVELRHEGVDGLVLRGHQGLAPVYALEYYQAEQYAEHAERVADRAGCSHVIGAGNPVGMGIQEGLLGGAECRGVGGGSAEETHCVGQTHVLEGHKGERRSRGRDKAYYSQDVESDSSLPQRGEKSRPHLYAEGIYEEYESEILGKGHHLRVQPESGPVGNVAEKYAGEEDQGHAQADAFDFYLPQREAQGADQGEIYYRLQDAGLCKQFAEPVHINIG